MSQSNHLNFHHQNDLQPRPQRKRKRNPSDRGLPPDSELRNLAAAYLNAQRQYWPELVKSGVLPEPTTEVLDAMVEAYKAAHQSGQVDAKAIYSRLTEALSGTTPPKLGTIYSRYSCDNSSPTSIIDQVANALRKAREEGCFVPWEFVFADYSVSGLDASRRGYTNCKSVIHQLPKVINTTYIDDFTRASRDSLEWWKLASICKRAQVRMMGASDSFDLASPNWEIWITIYGLLSRLFIRSLREKVERGMKGAARRRTCLGKPPMGFTRKVLRDENGKPLTRPSGKPLYEWAVDETSRKWVKLLFEKFVVHKMSAYKIAKEFNRLKVDGADTWTESTVKKMLSNPAYVGTFVWNRKRREYDNEHEKWVIRLNPMTEWVVSFEPDKAIISVETWRLARRMLKKLKRPKKDGAGPAKSRNQQHASTLFSGTIVCGYCGRELMLYRSTGKYKSMFCMNGREGVYGCQLSTSKSTRVIENCLLQFLRQSILTESAVEELVSKANEHLNVLAARPKIDVAPLRSKIANLQKKVDRLVLNVENLNESKQELREGYERRIVQLQKEIKILRKELQNSEKSNTPVPRRLSKKCVKTYLADLRDVLNQEIPQAADAIRKLTGPISITQETIPGKKFGARWIATFSPNLLALLRQIAGEKDYPDSITLEYLRNGNWTIPIEVSAVIEEVPKYENLAPKFKELHDSGVSVHEIAYRHKLSWQVTLEIINFAITGMRPRWYLTDDPVRFAGWKHYKELAPLVAELHDVRKLDWGKIVARVQQQTGKQISVIAALRAYEWAHRRIYRESAGCIQKKVRLGEDMYQQFKELVSQGITNGAELARRIGCTRSTTNRWKKQLQGRE